MKLIVLALAIQMVASWKPLDPEEALFIYTRCVEDFSKQSSNPSVALAKWAAWKLEPVDDPATKCYTKCVLVKMGLLDSEGKTFMPERVEQQWKAYQTYNFADESIVMAYKNALASVGHPASGSCKDVFLAYQAIHSQHWTTMQKIFHGLPENNAKIYADLGKQIRQKQQSYFVFCENKYYPQGANERNQLCQIRAYEVFENDDTYKKLMVCIFRGLRYFTDANQINEMEIIRDFEQVGKPASEIRNLLESCRTGVPADGSNESIVLHYYKCLVTGSLQDDFKEAFNYRELRSENYAYKLKPNTPPYSKAVVDARMTEIDDLQCPA